jgi:hypothetical protein
MIIMLTRLSESEHISAKGISKFSLFPISECKTIILKTYTISYCTVNEGSTVVLLANEYTEVGIYLEEKQRYFETATKESNAVNSCPSASEERLKFSTKFDECLWL